MHNTNLLVLQHIQKNTAHLVSDVASKVGLSANKFRVWIPPMEESGIICQNVALLKAENKSVFEAVRINQHNAYWLHQFCTMVPTMYEVGELYPMSGKVDYIFCLVVDDMTTYDALFCKPISNDKMTNYSSSVATEQIKFSTTPPLTVNNTDGSCHVS